MFFVEAGAENPVAAGCVSAAISMLYLESADAAIPVGAFAGYAVRSWLRHLFGGSGELDGCVPADPDLDGAVRSCGWCERHHGTDGTAVRVCRGCFDNLSSGGIRWIFSL